MSKFIITNTFGYQRVKECEHYELGFCLEEDDVLIIKIIDEDIIEKLKE